MKKILSFVFLLGLIIFFYISFIYVFNINKLFLPDFWLIIVLFVGIYSNKTLKLLIVFFLGILKDVFEIGVFGVNTFLFLITAFFINDILECIYKEKMLNIFIAIFCLSAVYYFAKYLLYYLFNYDVFFSFEYLLTSLMNCLIAPFIFRVLLRLEYWIQNVAE
ncbi:MAG: rod shape-determining protein MreD [bacterium]|nr:rod shape-determining protein MreD [bacterium]